MTGVSYMIPFVAAGGLLIALGFLFGGYDITADGPTIAVDNTFFNLPDLDELGLENALFDSPVLRLPRRAALHPRRGGVRLPGPGARRLHRLRHRRPPGHRTRLRRWVPSRGTINSGFLGGIVGGVLAGIVAHWITELEGPDLDARA